eukprot:294876-Chlamydomonas_euryale.AAC.2
MANTTPSILPAGCGGGCVCGGGGGEGRHCQQGCMANTAPSMLPAGSGRVDVTGIADKETWPRWCQAYML